MKYFKHTRNTKLFHLPGMYQMSQIRANYTAAVDNILQHACTVRLSQERTAVSSAVVFTRVKIHMASRATTISCADNRTTTTLKKTAELESQRLLQMSGKHYYYHTVAVTDASTYVGEALFLGCSHNGSYTRSRASTGVAVYVFSHSTAASSFTVRLLLSQSQRPLHSLTHPKSGRCRCKPRTPPGRRWPLRRCSCRGQASHRCRGRSRCSTWCLPALPRIRRILRVCSGCQSLEWGMECNGIESNREKYKKKRKYL